MLSFEEMREIFQRTQIVRKPTYGIISGYHELPYVCLGDSLETGHQTTEVRGKVKVSPRFLIRPQHCEPSYDEIFGEDNVDAQLAGRVFGFLGFRGRPVECESEELRVQHLDTPVQQALSRTLDELERYEDITTGVFLTPNSQYYPVSVEAFIASILEDEFAA
ncbi:MAG: hypothetical protein GY851_25105 [bacterium]|nr:hypothetical protein [bacterium]